jgi:DNA mismatch repair protein MutL
MGCIQRLTNELSNQIAAGEVVERPASVVKELVENALDAGATRVDVDIELGGTTLVRVCDDGDGMAPDDAVLCLERHATSKIARFTDLADLGTFGFRGEALPSIASVSRMVLRTRPRDASEGVEVRVDGGSAPLVKPIGSKIGTTFEIRELFYNVPARRKFLKATATESAHVSDVLLGMALARYDVTFVLTRDSRVVREHLRASNRAERARSILSGERLIECRAERGDIRIEALLAPPERARAGTTGLSILVNGRPVRDRQLARAVTQAYGSVLEGGRFPLGVVWIDVPPAVVDVNVHPQKAEVRFADARSLFDAVTRGLHDALAHAFGLPALGPHSQAPVHFPRPAVVPVPAAASEVLNDGNAPAAAQPTPETSPWKAVPQAFERALFPSGNLFASRTVSNAPMPLADTATTPPVFEKQSGTYAGLRYIGQMRNMFLLCEGQDGLYVLDQHAAAERVTFDRLKRAHAASGVTMQRVLVPQIVELSPSDVSVLEENQEEVLRLGVEVRAVGDNAVAVHGVPALLRQVDPQTLIRNLVEELSRVAGRPFRGAIDLVLATMACHGSVRAGDTMAPEEVTALLHALDTAEFAGHCPHGRPLVMRMPFSELERRVGR